MSLKSGVWLSHHHWGFFLARPAVLDTINCAQGQFVCYPSETECQVGTFWATHTHTRTHTRASLCFVVAYCHDYCTSQWNDLAQLAPASKGLSKSCYVQRLTLQWITLSTLLMMAHKAETAVQSWSVDPVEDVIFDTHTHTHTHTHRHVVYLISCRQCGFQYVGETSQLLRCRINQHRACIRRPNPTKLIAKHFASTGHSLEDLQVMPIEQLTPKPNESQYVLTNEEEIEKSFGLGNLVPPPLDPYGLNDKIQSWGSLSQRGQGSLVVAYALFNKHAHRPHVKHASGKHRARARRRQFDPRSFLDGLSSSASSKTCFLHNTRTQVFSLGHRSLGSLDTYLAGDFTTNVSQGQLRVVRDLVNFRLGLGHSQSQPGQDKSNLKSKVFLQVLFDNKGIDAIGLSSILRSPEVVSTLPSDFLIRSHWSVINTLPLLQLKF